MVKTEQDILVELKESIRQVVNDYNNGILNEMAYQRKAYKDNVNNLFPQLLTNWCLVRFCSLSGRTETKEHWRGELKGFMRTISRYSVKGDDEKLRRKIFFEIIEENDFKDLKYINLTVGGKFLDVGISIEDDVYIQVLNECVDSIDNVVEVLLMKNLNAINEYVKDI